jgi:hypothetical protein
MELTDAWTKTMSDLVMNGFAITDDLTDEQIKTLETYGYVRYLIPNDPHVSVTPVIAHHSSTFGDIWRRLTDDEHFRRFNESMDRHKESAVEKSRVQQALDEIMVKQDEARQHLFDILFVKPGALSTLGDDFTVEFGEVEYQHEDRIKYPNEVRVVYRQEITFRTKRE